MRGIGCAVVALSLLVASPAGGQQQSGVDPQTRRLQAEAFQKGGLRSAAAITGTYTRIVPMRQWSEPVSIEDLVQNTDVVIVGTVANNASRLANDDKSILMDYAVQVNEVIRGHRSMKEATVVVPGGRVNFPDGSWAQVSVSDFHRPTDTATYVWFLNIDADNQRVGSPKVYYSLAHGALGLYRLSGDTPVAPSGNARSAFAKWLTSVAMDQATFLKAVRTAAQ